MKRLIILATVLALLPSCAAPSRELFDIATSEAAGDLQTMTLDSAYVEISVPRTWLAKKDIREDPDVALYHFRRERVYDSKGRAVIPNLAVIAEHVPEGIDLVEYTASKRTQPPYNEMTSQKLEWARPGQDAMVCYQATYNDPNGLPHRIYFVHAMMKGKGIQIIIDGTESVFEMLDPEYKLILSRIRLMK